MPTIGARLKSLRAKSGKTLLEAGNLAGVSKQNLYKYESNIITNIPSNKIEALANIYNVSPAYIMGWEEKETANKRIEEPVNNFFGKRLKMLREEKEMSLRELSTATGVNKTSLSEYENGQADPALKTAKTLSEYFGETLDYMAGYTSQRSVKKTS